MIGPIGRLADLCDKIGARMSGSPQADAAVEQIAAALRAAGLNVSLQPVKVPHWVRGEEQAEMTEYPGRPAGVIQHLHLTTLGGSVATPAQGISGQVLVVHSFDELRAREGEARGKIVVFDVPFNETLAVNGRAGTAYGQGVVYRAQGASAAARAGATAALVRTVGGANYRLPHTGEMNYDPEAPQNSDRRLERGGCHVGRASRRRRSGHVAPQVVAAIFAGGREPQRHCRLGRA